VPGYRNLLTIKGIGPVLAAVFVTEIGDITRFPSAGALCCWAGLTPRHYESDKTVHRGHISKEGDTLVRWAAVEAIQRQTEPAVKAVREGIVARRGMKRPQHRQGRRRPTDARGHLLRAARR
jgi:transposase